MRGRTFSNGTRVAELVPDDDFDDYFDDDNERTDTELGLDLGLMYRPSERWSFGLAADNVNGPEFDLADQRSVYRLKPLLRAGAAWRPLRWFNAALDLDLNAVDSQVVRGLEYQYVNGGVEFLLGRWFAGRVGACHNLGATNSKTVLTGGAGFIFKRFSIELALGLSPERTRIETGPDPDTVPRSVAASLQFNWRPRGKDGS
jgi:hypothetical protein